MQVTTNRGFAPTTMQEAVQFSEMLASSSMVPKAYQGKPMDVLVCVQWGYELNLAPMAALQNIAVINGKPSVYGDTMLALVQASAVCEDIEEYFEGEGTANPVAVCVASRKGRKPVTARFSRDDAQRAGLWNKVGPWQAYPKRMLQMRARGFALRDAFPDILKGLVSAEEAHDHPGEKLAPKAFPKTSNPLDRITQVTEPFAIEEAMADTIEPKPAAAVDDVEGLDEVLEVLFPEEIAAIEEITVLGFVLMVPGHEDAFSQHATLEEWQDAYEELAEKTARAGKRPARDRMTALRELKDLNAETLKNIDSVARVRHTANYAKRLAALGAAQ
jgi:hypothetical protein